MDSVSTDTTSHHHPETPPDFRWSCVVINYNGAAVIEETLDSINRMVPPPSEIIVVDDGSQDGSPDLVAARYPDVTVHCLPENTGRTSIVRNAGLARARERHVLVTDNDIIFQPDAVSRLVEVMNSDPKIGVCTPIAIFNDGTGEICAKAHGMHFLCWSEAGGPQFVTDLKAGDLSDGVGCGIGLFNRDVLDEVGGFDEDLVVGWGDDGELHQRMRLFGYRAVSVRDVVIDHNARRGSPRAFGQVHNRWIMLLKHYRLRSLILFSPSFLLFELLLFVYLQISGERGAHSRTLREVLGRRQKILTDRKRIQAGRRVPDRDILGSGNLDLSARLSSNAVRIAMGTLNRLFRLHWALLRRFV